MSATTETQSPSEKHLATLNQILLLLNLHAGILGLVLTVYGKQLGASAVEIGLLFSVYSLHPYWRAPWSGTAWTVTWRCASKICLRA